MKNNLVRNRTLLCLLWLPALLIIGYFSTRNEYKTKLVQVMSSSFDSAPTCCKKPLASPIKSITSREEIQRILNIANRTDRMMEILKLLPPERDWPENLGFGFKSNKHPAHSVLVSPGMNISEAEMNFFAYINKHNIDCRAPTRLGGQGDGGWHLCVAGPYNITKPCLAYSLGMSFPSRWGFDLDIMNKYGCADMAFDPSMKKTDHKPYELMWYHNMGVGGKNEVNKKNWTIRTFGKVLQNLGHTQSVIDVLKMDIEHSEWEAFETIFLEGALENVKQIAFEIHTSELVGQKSDASDYTYYWLLFKAFDRIGFKYWRHDFNFYRSYVSSHTKLRRPILANLNFINANLLLPNC